MKAWLGRIALAGLTGLLLAFAFPPAGLWPLAWIAFVPLLYACQTKRLLPAFLLGMLGAGGMAVVATLGWIYRDRNHSGEETWITLGCALFGFVLALTTAIYGEIKRPGIRHLVGLAALAVLMEYGLLRILPVTFAITQAPVAGMRWLASLGGIWVVSFLLWFGNLYVADSLRRRRPWWPVAATIAIVALGGWIWETLAPSGDERPVVLVQSEAMEYERLIALSGDNPASLAVWPEFGGLSAAPGGDPKALREWTRDARAPAVVTSFPDGQSPKPFNVASIFEKGKESPRYAKRMLFGGEKSMHQAGSRAVAVPWQGTVVALSICFDSCFPDLLAASTRSNEVGFVALPTIDPPAPYHWAAAMHAAFTPFRAAESGVSIVRVDGYAYSQVVDSSGRVRVSLPPGEFSRKASVPLARRWTLYRWIGDAFLWVCAALVVNAWWPMGRRPIRG